MKNRVILLLAVSLLVLAPGYRYASAQSGGNIQQLIGQQEGGQGIVNSSSSAAGLYQTNFASLKQAGFITGPQDGCCGATAYNNASWNGPLAQQYGVTSLQDYLNNPQAQAAAFQSAASTNYNSLMSNGGSQYIGQTYNGLVLNQSALVECSYVLGGAGCANDLANGTVPSYVQTRMAAAEPYDSSSITGSPTSPGGGSLNGSTPTTTPNPTGSALGLYCSPAVAQALVNRAQAKIQGDLAIASNPATGYSLLDGTGVLSQAGLGGGAGSSGSGSGSGIFSVGGAGGMRSMTCLNNLLSGNGLGSIFNPPSLDSLMKSLTNMACQGLKGMFSQMLSPLTSSLTQSSNLGGFFPGMGMGNIGGGLNIGSLLSGSGGGGSNGWSLQNGGDTSWYSSSGMSSIFQTGAPGSATNPGTPSNLGGLMNATSGQSSSGMGSIFQ